jgi:hypothetical protein
VPPVAETIGRIDTWRSEAGVFDVTPIFSTHLAMHTGQNQPRSAVRRMGLVEPSDETPVLTTLHRFHAHMGDWSWERQWIPWAFELSPRHPAAVSSVGLGAIAAGVSLYTAGSVAAEATALLPAQGVFRLVNPGQISVQTTPLWDEAATLILNTPGLLPRMLRVRESVGQLIDPLSRDPRASDASSAMFDLMRWLNRGRDEVADICRFATRTSQYWSTGKKPRPATVRRLFEVHSFVGSLVRALGRSAARRWLEERPTEEGSRLEALATEEGLTDVLREASRFLFADRLRGERPRPEAIGAEEAMAPTDELTPVRVTGEPRRPRRPPRHAT